MTASIQARTKALPPIAEFIALVALISSLVALSIDAMLPALPQIASDLGVQDMRQTQWVITSLIFGMSFGQLFFGPLSDSYGRKFGILTGILLFCLGSMLSMLATSLPMLLVGRVLQGIGVAGPRIASLALVRDIYVGDAMARVMSFVMMVFIMVPMVAPLVGQAVLLAFNWRAIFGLFILLSAISALWLVIRQPETLDVANRRPFHFRTIWRTSVTVVRHPRVLGFSLTAGLIFGALLSYVASAQAIFQGIYQLGEAFPFYFGALAFGIGLASFANSWLVVRFGAERLSVIGLWGLLLFTLILTLVAFLNQGIPPLAAFMGLGFLMFFCVGILFGNLNALAMVPLGRMAGIGAAVVGSVSNVVAVLVSVLVGWFYNDTLLPILLGISVCTLVALMIVWWIRNLPDTPLE
ncbi:multidrug effflux MFS transporter [Reinekea sp.]|jgi:DHA1 family bicyclomycin/chloramphenicol resistance-like MFS transporter|uniref:multidrug effflux MFS transporter n=1 Tax=Reinekea sp. TaxID=1970455 RepID=UPI002A83D76C|nr:multidrug effflux MFS transporter [Reinekea sp.]